MADERDAIVQESEQISQPADEKLTKSKGEKVRNYVIAALSLILVVYTIVGLIIYPFPSDIIRTSLLIVTLPIVFLTVPASKKNGKIRWFDYLFLFMGLAAFIYAFFQMEEMYARGGVWTTPADIVFTVIGIIVILEATRRTVGNALPIIALLFILYTLFGQHLPGMFGHNPYSIRRIATSIFCYEGIFGTVSQAVSTFVLMFMIFAAFLEQTGTGEIFMNISKAIAGGKQGGPARVAVVSSALFGSISGSAVANVAATGSITIPMMKKLGYSPRFSGAVEAAASTGGQIMPPVMAAGAFLMAEYLGIGYGQVIIAAAIPAILYFLTIWISVGAVAGKRKMPALSKDELPKMKDLMKKDWYMLAPIVLVVVLLVGFNMSAIRSAFFGCVASYIVGVINKARRQSLGFKGLLAICVSSAKGIAPLAASCSCAGIIVGCITITGFALKVSTLIMSIGGNTGFFALLLAMLVAIIFGMGLPTTVSYILCVSVLAPALISMNFNPIAAHLFIFYFACLSGLTPPVALAAYTGASIAGSKPFETAVESCKLAIIAFVIPYMFMYNNAYLFSGSLVGIIQACVCGICLCYALSAVLQGFWKQNCNMVWRAIYLVISVLLILQSNFTDYLGVGLFVAATVVMFFTNRNKGARIQSVATQND